MKILCVTKHFYPENFRINDFLFALAKKGHKITVLTNRPIYPYTYSFDFKSKLYSHHQGVDIFRIPIIFFGNNILSKIFYFISFITNVSIVSPFLLIGKKFDVIFTFAPSPPTVAIPAIILGKLKKIPNIMWLHDVWPESLNLIGLKNKDFTYRIISKLVIQIYKNCSSIFTQSRSLAAYVSKLKINKKIFFLPVHAENNYLNLPLKKKNHKKFNIFFFGNIGLAQDIPSVLECITILKYYKNIKWTFVGEGAMRGWLEEKIVERGLKKIVKIKSAVPLHKVSKLYLQADALLLSLRDNKCFNLIIPAKFQSYLASRIPIFAMADGEVYSLMKKLTPGVYCEAGNYKKLSTLILSFLKLSSNKKKNLTQRGFLYYSKNFSIDVVVNLFEKYVKKIIKSNNSNFNDYRFTDKK